MSTFGEDLIQSLNEALAHRKGEGPAIDRAPAGGAQRAAVSEDRGQPPQPLRGCGPSGFTRQSRRPPDG